MFRPFPAFVGLRYARARRRTRFISVVSAVALLGLALGVLALIVVLSVMNGFDRELRGRILALVPHILVTAEDGALSNWEELAARLRAQPGIRAAAPYIGGTAMISTRGVVRGIQLNAIDPARERDVSVIAEHMLEGGIDGLSNGGFGIVIGNILARSLSVRPGDSVNVMLPELSVTPAGVYPRMRRFTVVGIFAVGAQVDGTTALVHLADGARLYRTGSAVHGIRLASANADEAIADAAALREVLPSGLKVQDWSETQGSLFQAIRMEKRMVSLLLLVIVAVAAFNVVSILTMVVAEKRAAIAVFRTMGASPAQVMAIFIMQGVLIGLAGVAIGVGIGVPAALEISAIVAFLEQLLGFRVFNPNVYFISFIPSKLEIGDVLMVAGSAMALTVLATLYPARRAARIGPAEVLRYE